MRLSIASLLCLGMLASFAYAELPTRTLANGGWFAIGRTIASSPGLTVSTFCNGNPCTDANFSDAFGSVLTGMVPVAGIPPFYDARNKATDALINNEFGIEGPVCQPGSDTGQPAILISGFARYYTLKDFFYTQLVQGGLMSSGEPRISEFTNAIFLDLNNQNLGALGPLSSGHLIDRNNGQPFNEAFYPISFTLLDIQLYQLIANWAGKMGFVVNAFKVTNLKTLSFTCP